MGGGLVSEIDRLLPNYDVRGRHEIRIACPDPRSRRKFALYWRLVGPFSGLIRKRMLEIVRDRAEAAG